MAENLLKIAKKPAVTLSSQSTVQDAAELMAKTGVSALAVIDRDKLVGIFSERDLLRRVVAEKVSPLKTRLADVMTKKIKTVTEQTKSDDALRMMHEGNFRHLPIVDNNGKVLGMLSVRDLLHHRIEELDRENKSLSAFIAADGSGG